MRTSAVDSWAWWQVKPIGGNVMVGVSGIVVLSGLGTRCERIGID